MSRKQDVAWNVYEIALEFHAETPKKRRKNLLFKRLRWNLREAKKLGIFELIQDNVKNNLSDEILREYVAFIKSKS